MNVIVLLIRDTGGRTRKLTISVWKGGEMDSIQKQYAVMGYLGTAEVIRQCQGVKAG